MRLYTLKKAGSKETATPATDADTADTKTDTETKPKPEPVPKAPAGPNAEFESQENSDLALMRLGYFNHLKLNNESMV